MEKIELLLIRALSEQDEFMTTKEIAAKSRCQYENSS